MQNFTSFDLHRLRFHSQTFYHQSLTKSPQVNPLLPFQFCYQGDGWLTWGIHWTRVKNLIEVGPAFDNNGNVRWDPLFSFLLLFYLSISPFSLFYGDHSSGPMRPRGASESGWIRVHFPMHHFLSSSLNLHEIDTVWAMIWCSSGTHNQGVYV